MKLRDKVEKLMAWLGGLTKVCRIYGHEHRLTKEALDSFYKLFNEILAERKQITVGIIGDEIAFEKGPFYELSKKRKSFIAHLKALNVKKISFFRGASKREILEFIQILGMKPKSMKEAGGIDKVFAKTSIQNIGIGDIGAIRKDLSKDGAQEKQGKDQEIDLDENIDGDMDVYTKKSYQENIDFIQKTFENIKGNEALSVESARHIVSGLVNSLIRNKNLLLMLTSIRLHDENRFVNNVNTAIFTVMQAEMLGVEKKYLNEVTTAALLHDIGKISTTADPVEDPERVTVEDIKRRAEEDIRGAKILLETEGENTLSAVTAFEHNMWYDMSGFPKKLYGKELNIVSMMISISNYYNKLRNSPSFFEDGGPEKVYEDMVALAGKKFHPDILNNFFTAIGVYPPGTLVELDNGEVGLVIQGSVLDKKRPQVEVLYNSEGEKYKEPRIINLLEKDRKGQFMWTIKRSLSPMEQFEIPERYLSLNYESNN